MLGDNDKNRLTALTTTLKEDGYYVNTYLDGGEGFEGLTHRLVDQTVIDIKMPRINGIEPLTKHKKCTELPVIFLTFKGDQFDEISGLTLEADDYKKKHLLSKFYLRMYPSG